MARPGDAAATKRARRDEDTENEKDTNSANVIHHNTVHIALESRRLRDPRWGRGAVASRDILHAYFFDSRDNVRGDTTRITSA